MNVTIDNLNFDHSRYDEVADVLYLHRGQPQAAADSEGTPEGHVIRFGADGQIIGVTLINARALLDRDGKLTITLPHPVEVSGDTLAAAVAA